MCVHIFGGETSLKDLEVDRWIEYSYRLISEGMDKIELKITEFWDVVSCNLEEIYQR
jgi:hypothetical protein